MKRRTPFLYLFALLFGTIIASTENSFSAENWKGLEPNADFLIGIQTGYGRALADTGFVVAPNFSHRIIKHGFVPEISNQVFIEASFGPIWTYTIQYWQYSAHLRWDFIYDDTWTPYVVGGLAGTAAAPAYVSSTQFSFYPRFGIGIFYRNATWPVLLRAEVSHEQTTVGVAYPF